MPREDASLDIEAANKISLWTRLIDFIRVNFRSLDLSAYREAELLAIPMPEENLPGFDKLEPKVREAIEFLYQHNMIIMLLNYSEGKSIYELVEDTLGSAPTPLSDNAEAGLPDAINYILRHKEIFEGLIKGKIAA